MLHFQHHPGFCPDCGEKIGYTAAVSYTSPSPSNNFKPNPFFFKEIVAHNRQFHINERPIICEICGESFTRNQQYQVHLQNHDKAKEILEQQEPGN